MENIRNILEEVIAEVIEQFTFMLEENIPVESLPALKGEYLYSEIGFTTPSEEGVIELIAPEDLCREMAANILGVEPNAIKAEEAHDALRELTNITCGAFMEQHFGNSTKISISVPELSTISQSSWEVINQDITTVGLVVDEEPLLARCKINH